MAKSRSDVRASGASSAAVETALSRSVPQEVTYEGQQFIELKLAPSDFLASRSADDNDTKGGS